MKKIRVLSLFLVILFVVFSFVGVVRAEEKKEIYNVLLVFDKGGVEIGNILYDYGYLNNGITTNPGLKYSLKLYSSEGEVYKQDVVFSLDFSIGESDGNYHEALQRGYMELPVILPYISNAIKLYLFDSNGRKIDEKDLSQFTKRVAENKKMKEVGAGLDDERKRGVFKKGFGFYTGFGIAVLFVFIVSVFYYMEKRNSDVDL